MTFVLPSSDPGYSTRIARLANMVGQNEILVFVETYVPASVRVVSFDNTHSPITQQSIETLARHKGWQTERVFDAAHGRRYLLLVYPSDTPYVNIKPNPHRVACWDFLTSQR